MSESLDLLVLGNGFDIEAGLKSKFICFLREYVGDKIIQKFDDCFNEFISPNYTAFDGEANSIIEGFKNYYFDPTELKNAIVTVLLQKQVTGQTTWSDVEQNLQQFLVALECDYIHNAGLFSKKWVTFITSNSGRPNSFPFSDGPARGQEFFGICFYSQFKNHNTVSTEIHMNNKETLRKEVYRFLKDEIYSFEQAFGTYISNQVATKKEYLQDSKEILGKINYDNHVMGLLDFNYTGSVLKEKGVFPFYNVSNVHGTIEEKNLIIGIDGSNIDVKSLNYQFTKTFRQFSMHEGHRTNSILDPVVETIIFFGHSLGEQDYSYFQAIFDHYELYNSQIRLRFIYKIYCSSEADKIKHDFYNRVVRLIQKYADTLENDGHRRNLLHKLLLEERVQIQDLDNIN